MKKKISFILVSIILLSTCKISVSAATLPEKCSPGYIKDIQWTGSSLDFTYVPPTPENGTHWVYPIDGSGIVFYCYINGRHIGSPRKYQNQTLIIPKDGIRLSLSGSCYAPVWKYEGGTWIPNGTDGATVTSSYANVNSMSVYIDFNGGGYTTSCSGPEVSRIDATCTQPAYITRNCNTCHKDWTVSSGNPNGHKWSYENSEIYKAPTCYETGIREFTCCDCGYKVNKTEPKYQFNVFCDNKRINKIYKGDTLLFNNTTVTYDKLPDFIKPTGIADLPTN